MQGGQGVGKGVMGGTTPPPFHQMTTTQKKKKKGKKGMGVLATMLCPPLGMFGDMQTCRHHLH